MGTISLICRPPSFQFLIIPSKYLTPVLKINATSFDTIADPTDESWMLVYYNGRNGWKGARETVGVSRVS
jgi:hypothetical protein